MRSRARSSTRGPTSSAACASVMLMSWPLWALVAGVKIGAGRREDSVRPRGSGMPQMPPVCRVVLPGRPGQISAGDALDRQRIGFSDEHRSAGQRGRLRPSLSGEVGGAGRDHVVFGDRAQAIEPERGDLRQDLSLVWNPGRKDVVERRDPIGRDNQELVAEVENIADLSLSIGCTPGECRLENGRGERQRIPQCPKEVHLTGTAPRRQQQHIASDPHGRR